MTPNNAIMSFRNEYRFLSNFYSASVAYDGMQFPTVEHAYQAAKAKHREDRVKIQQAHTPGAAKRLGHRIEVCSGWWDDNNRIIVMRHLVRLKFTHPHLAARLLATGDVRLVEGNTWRDNFWGVYQGRGENHLGEILMQVRQELRDGPVLKLREEASDESGGPF